ncbi:MAG: hypothetical protein ACLP5H_23355 [Desulfomonilaceae bacterium]
MKTELKQLIIKGEKLLDGSYGLQEGYAAYESWREDCLEFFQELQSDYGRSVKNPGDVEAGISFLKEFLPREDSNTE